MKIALIGSRKTRPEVMAMILGVMRRATAEYGVELHSGGCEEGPDKVVTHLALKHNIKHIIYLPNRRRLEKFSRLGDLTPTVAGDYESDTYRDIIRQLHPAPDNVIDDFDDYVWKLHGRNLNIIAGSDLATPVDAVVFAAGTNTDGTVKGGTGIGVAYARSLDIPCFNFEDMADVVKFLSLLKK